MKVNKRKCQVLYMGKNNPRHEYMLGADSLESSSAKKYIRVDNMLTTGQQCTLAAKKDQQYPGLH